MILIVLSIALILVVTTVIFTNTSPEFGGKPSKESLAKFSKSKQFENKAFKNNIPTKQSTGFKWSSIPKFFTNGNNKKPSIELPQKNIQSSFFNTKTSAPRLTWFGHSALLLEIDKTTILIDPMFGNVPAPHPILGSSRFNEELPIEIDSLPKIDLVLISHDHYDHLDYGSILKLKDKVNLFYVPLGIKAHLTAWGIKEERIKEFDWWESKSLNNISFTSAPARHFSGRGFTRNNTLWTSWIIKSEKSAIYFSGDSGYGPHFKEIGEKYGPFDFAMIECGQYNEQWTQIHMNPEEAILATVDLNAKTVLPIHWGAFKLALHSWDDPIVRATKKAEELNVEITSPIIGESIIIGAENYPKSKWWTTIPKSK